MRSLMNRKAYLWPLQITAMLTALAVGSPLHAKAKKKAKRPPPVSTITERPTGVLTNANDQSYVSGLSSENEVSRSLMLTTPTELAPSWAGNLGAHVMSQRVINYLEYKYTAAESFKLGGQVRNFVYFYGFDISSQDVRGSAFYSIDPQQELDLRIAMAKSLRAYMLGKGLMEYLKTTTVARPYVSTVEKVEQASQINVSIGAQKQSAVSNSKPWIIKTGPDLGSRTLFARANKGSWDFEVRNSFWLDRLTASAGYGYYRSYYTLKYSDYSRHHIVTTDYEYRFAKLWWANFSSDFPTGGKDQSRRIFNTIGVKHLF